MNRPVKNFFQYINEALNQDEWANYGEDTYVAKNRGAENIKDEEEDVVLTAQYVKEMLFSDEEREAMTKPEEPVEDEEGTEEAGSVEEEGIIDDSTLLSQVLVTGPEIGTGLDWKYFYHNIIPKSKILERRKLDFDGYYEFFTLYQYEDAKFMTVDVKDFAEYSFVFIKEKDYEFFDKLNLEKVYFEPADQDKFDWEREQFDIDTSIKTHQRHRA